MLTPGLLISFILLFCASCASTSPTTSTLEKDKNNKPKMMTEEDRQVQATLHFLLGQFSEMSGDINNAGGHYGRGYSLDPNSYLAGKALKVAVATRPKEEVLIEARKMALLYPQSASMHFLYGQILSLQQNYQDAEEEVRKAIALDPKYEDAMFFLIGLLASRENIKGAIDEAHTLVDVFPGNPHGWKTLAFLLIKFKKVKQALQAAEKAYYLREKNPEIAVTYAYLLELNGRTKEAAALYGNIFSFTPGSEELAARVVKLYRELGGLDQALVMLEQMILRLSPAPIALKVQKSFILWEMGNFEKAADYLKLVSNENPDSELLHYMNGLAAEKVGRLREAVLSYRAVSNSSPYKPHAVFRSSLVFYGQEQFQNALLEAGPLIDKPYSEDSYLYIANLYRKLGRLDDATEMLERAIKQYPEQADLLFTMGVYLEQSGDIDRCIEYMKETIALDQSYSSAYNYIGYIYAERGENLKEAEALLLKALELKPGEGAYLDSLGWVYFQQGKFDKALKMLLQASEKIATDYVVWEHLGRVYEKKSKFNQALEAYRKAYDLAEQDSDKARINEWMSEVSGKLNTTGKAEDGA